MQWLDLARYADTHGYHIDSQRDMWKWRDWVIDAFNRNMPFDRFAIEQLAGDLLPNATVAAEARQRFQPQPHDQLRGRRDSRGVSDRVRRRPRGHHRQRLHGPDAWAARAATITSTIPISQKDYYRFFAFFNTVAEKGLDGKNGNAAPILEMPTAEQASEVGMAAAGHRRSRGGACPRRTPSRCSPTWQKTRPRDAARSLRATDCWRITLSKAIWPIPPAITAMRGVEGRDAFRRRPARAVCVVQRRGARGVPGLSGGAFRRGLLDAQRRHAAR